VEKVRVTLRGSNTHGDKPLCSGAINPNEIEISRSPRRMAPASAPRPVVGAAFHALQDLRGDACTQCSTVLTSPRLFGEGMLMPIPAFDDVGLLPDGVHDCQLAEIQERFTWNERRVAIWAGFLLLLQELAAINMLYPLYIDGGFVTDRDDPSDVDLALDLCNGAPVEHQRDALFHFHQRHAAIHQEMRVDYYPNLPGSPHDFRQFFQYVGLRTAMSKRLPPQARKGILRVPQWAPG
jgi:hypothetical protein